MLVLILYAFSAVFSLTHGLEWNSVKVKYTALFDGFYSIPLTVNDIKGEYVYLETHKEFPKASLYCYPNDPRVCPIYDGYGRICGLRVAYVKKDLAVRAKGNLPYSYNKPIFKEGTAYGMDFYYIDVLFIKPEGLLANGGPASRTEQVGDGVYIRMDGQTWTEMPRKEKDATAVGFTKQACFLGMGLHYFYNMTKGLDCNYHQPPFLLYEKGELAGLGLIPFGSFSKTKRGWFEDPPKFVINTIVPNSPKCLADWVGKYGTISLHIFFKKSPRLTCLL
ncbi:hypothetical protein J6590_028596 [Homalodisca vitripennis]|nr:hypothetical protein J6590_028596 [Homalodisca vitripennis]